MGDYDNLEETNLCADGAVSPQKPSTKRILAGLKWGKLGRTKANKRPKWKHQVKALQGAATRRT